MKIALALPSLDPQRGDMEALSFELVRRLVALKHEIHVVAQHFSDAGLELPIVSHRIRRTKSPLRRAAAVEAELRRIDADVIHDMGIGWYADAFTLTAGSPIRMRESRLGETSWWARPLQRLGMGMSVRGRQQAELARRQCSRTGSIHVPLSQVVAEDLQSLHGLPGNRIRVVHPGVDIKRFSPHTRKLRRDTTRRKLGIDTKALLLLSFADDQRQVGAWRVAFRALRRLVAQQVPVQLVVSTGSGSVFPQKLAERFGVRRHIKIVGPVSDRIPFYAAADVLLAFTRYAPFSLTVLEAAACGLPCITTRENGAAELFVDEGDCCVLDLRSPIDLAERIESFRDQDRWERMGRAARRTAMNYTLDRYAAKLMQIYEEIAKTQGHVDRDILVFPDDPSEQKVIPRAA